MKSTFLRLSIATCFAITTSWLVAQVQQKPGYNLPDFAKKGSSWSNLLVKDGVVLDPYHLFEDHKAAFYLRNDDGMKITKTNKELRFLLSNALLRL